MSAKRLYRVPGAIALVALLTLAGRSAFGIIVPHPARNTGNEASSQSLNIDSATRSYMAWAKTIEERPNGEIDSATRSYMAWAKAVEERSKATDHGDVLDGDRSVSSYGEWYGAIPQTSPIFDKAEALRLRYLIEQHGEALQEVAP